MIVVTVDLLSARGSQHNKGLFTMVVVNDGSGDERTGNYKVFLGRRGVTDPHVIIYQPLRRGRVENHARQSTHVGTLIRKAMEAVRL